MGTDYTGNGDAEKRGSKQMPGHDLATTAVSIEHAEHYTWGKDCDGWHLVKNEQLSVIEEVMPPGTSEVRHHHDTAQQFFYVLAGEVAMEVEGRTVQLPAGNGISIMPGAPHQISNPFNAAARFLVISQPPSHGDRFVD
jgi:mannose-6-phosphate isomerase-like protein (cupin superfamily)